MWSARRIGNASGKSAAEVNQELSRRGYLEGGPRNWRLTEKGKRYGEYRDESNGHHGGAHRSWSYILWNDSIAQEISGKKFPGVTWFCDRCRFPLGAQPGFDDYQSTWECKECSYLNNISYDNVNNIQR